MPHIGKSLLFNVIKPIFMDKVLCGHAKYLFLTRVSSSVIAKLS